METNASNPLLDFSGLPRFDAFRPEHVTPAIEQLIEEAAAVVAQLEAPSDNVTWDNFVVPLEEATERLGRAWGIVNHINHVADTPELRAVYNENQPKVTEFWTSLGQNEALFDKYKAIRAGADYDSLSPARKRIVENALRDFRLGGAELPADKKERFGAIQEQHAAISTRFSENVLDATNDYKLLIEDEAELAGIPDDARDAARAAAEAAGKTGYQFSLHFPSYFPILQFADNRQLRETIYRASATKASDMGTVFSEAEKWDNTQNIAQLLKLRHEEAQLLGYRNFAEVSLVPKMAESPEHVISFLEDLAVRARPFAEKDLTELRAFAKDELGIEDLQAWDVAYASEKLREQRYAFSAQEVKNYFPEPKVIEGLFKVVQTLFSVQITPDTAPVWHPDVRFYRIERDGQLVGQFYFDLYARAGKGQGAWMDDARGRRLATGGIVQTPVAYLTCNFTPPATRDGKLQPSLLTHDEVTTLFHEFGHGLHHMLTEVEELSVSGISGVEWDAVELPSQFMENFCWEWDVLQGMTAHVKTGEPLPRALYDKMLAAKNFQSGMQTLRQVEFSLIDMHLHYDFDPSSQQIVQELIDSVRRKFSIMIPPAFNRFQHSFGHIFAGGYAAGYYSYKWAEVLSADAYAAFEEALEAGGGELLAETGRRFQREVLAVGGSRPALESFTAFRGREPSIDALLRHSGMSA
ncbi:MULTISPECIES: M3 family metallopeptidase [unclassified Massilia]|uniref:M3 family metallopeptidase n=1 Tax=unclassified Massilia TaxID=2609279 RepID=UPI001785BD1E|nr:MULTISPECIES: M3 family metallopeptidase [unclassified Massilia]MBD8528651.1 M3 family metallopeptidase [Massilia sp. CFBP 13647]MBD8672255.1 M3 family metallopeptidase [Massilia sp. CFBP 13721]